MNAFRNAIAIATTVAELDVQRSIEPLGARRGQTSDDTPSHKRPIRLAGQPQ